MFNRLFDEAVPVVLAGDHRQERPPVDGGRWPVSVVGVPDAQTRDVLARVMNEALVHAGRGHFETGGLDASHFTVRALEPYREAAAPSDSISGEWSTALEEVGRTTPPLSLRLTGVTLSASGVMVKVDPVDDAPWELMRRVRAALGPLAWYEDQRPQRNIWYASVLHFAAPVHDAHGLVAWISEHRLSLNLDIVLDSLALIRFRYSDARGRRRMAMECWHTVRLSGREHVC